MGIQIRVIVCKIILTYYLSVNISKTYTYTKQTRSRTLLQAKPYFPQVLPKGPDVHHATPTKSEKSRL